MAQQTSTAAASSADQKRYYPNTRWLGGYANPEMFPDRDGWRQIADQLETVGPKGHCTVVIPPTRIDRRFRSDGHGWELRLWARANKLNGEWLAQFIRECIERAEAEEAEGRNPRYLGLIPHTEAPAQPASDDGDDDEPEEWESHEAMCDELGIPEELW